MTPENTVNAEHAEWNSTHDEIYWQRMARSHGDKIRMLSELGDVQGKKILEVGFGDAAILDVLHSQGAEVYGVDINPYVVASGSQKPYSDRLHTGSYADMLDLFAGIQFDAVVACSVVHEIYSYSQGLYAVEYLFQLTHKALIPGGVMLMRDMVEPPNGDQSTRLSLSDAWNKSAKKYLSLQPFGPDYEMEQSQDGSWVGSLRAATAMLYTINWGMASLGREAFELNQTLSQEGYRELIEKYGFTVFSQTYFQESYRPYLEPEADLFNVHGELLPYPDTNIVIKAVKS